MRDMNEGYSSTSGKKTLPDGAIRLESTYNTKCMYCRKPINVGTYFYYYKNLPSGQRTACEDCWKMYQK